MSAALRDAAHTMGNVLRGWAADSAGGMTCSEVDAVALVLVLAGNRDAAVDILRYHAEGDETDDLHDLRSGEGHKGFTTSAESNENAETLIYPDPDDDEPVTLGAYVDELAS